MHSVRTSASHSRFSALRHGPRVYKSICAFSDPLLTLLVVVMFSSWVRWAFSHVSRYFRMRQRCSRPSAMRVRALPPAGEAAQGGRREETQTRGEGSGGREKGRAWHADNGRRHNQGEETTCTSTEEAERRKLGRATRTIACAPHPTPIRRAPPRPQWWGVLLSQQLHVNYFLGAGV